jgi:hypothetical protein
VTTTVRCDAPRDFAARPVAAGKAAGLAPVVTFEVGVPGHTSARVIRLVAPHNRPEPSHPVVRATRKALTLGRALKTTVEAVMGTLVSAAAEKTAALV